MTTPTAAVCPTCLRPTEHNDPHLNADGYCVCSCCTCETTSGCCCTTCPCDSVKPHPERTRREEDEGLTEREMDAERAADEEAARAWAEGRDE